MSYQIDQVYLIVAARDQKEFTKKTAFSTLYTYLALYSIYVCPFQLSHSIPMVLAMVLPTVLSLWLCPLCVRFVVFSPASQWS